MKRIQGFDRVLVFLVGLGVCLVVGACGNGFASHQSETFLLEGETESDLVPLDASWVVSDDFAIDFVYSPDEMLNFDIEGYLQSHAPHLTQDVDEVSQVSYAEMISHFAAKEGMSPRLLIAMMELKSHLVSDSRTTASRPFGDLSDASGFLAQIRDVTQRLTKARYPSDSMQPSTSYQDALASVLSVDDRDRLGVVYRTLFPGSRSKKKVTRFVDLFRAGRPQTAVPLSKRKFKVEF